MQQQNSIVISVIPYHEMLLGAISRKASLSLYGCQDCGLLTPRASAR
jgi:hypothetical protein